MAFEQKEIDWITLISGASADIALEAQRQATRLDVIAEVAADINTISDTLLEVLDHDVQAPRNLLDRVLHRTRTERAYGDRTDPDDQFDIYADCGRLARTPENMTAMIKKFDELLKIEQKMKSATVNVDGVEMPVFTDKDIERELWTPLVRSGALPSNLVPDRYSTHAILFREASSIYEEKLAALPPRQTTMQMLKAGKELTQAVGATASAAIDLAGAIDATAVKDLEEQLAAAKDVESPDDVKIAGLEKELLEKKISEKDQAAKKAAMACGFNLVAGAITVTERAIDPAEKNRNKAVGDAFAAAALNGLSDLFGSLSKRVEADAVASGAGSDETAQNKMKAFDRMAVAAKAGLAGRGLQVAVTDALNKKDEGSLLKAISSAGDAVEQAFKLADVPDDPASGDGGTDGKWAAIGAQINNAMSTAPGVIAQTRRLVAEGSTDDPTRTGQLVAREMIKVAAALLGVFNPDGADSGSGEGAAAVTQLEGLDAAMTKMAGPDALARAEATVLKQIEDDKKAQIKEALASMTAEDVDEMAQKVEAERDKIKGLLDGADQVDGTDPQAAIDAIDRLMAEIEATRAFWDNLNAAVKGGIGTFALFFPAAGLAEKARQLAYDIVVMVKKGKELNDWLSNKAMMMASASAYLSPVQNRVANCKIAVSEATAKAALSMLGAVAEVVSLADPTGAGKAMSAGATLGTAGVDLLRKARDWNAIREGWIAFKEAREHPQDRKKARKALRKNATLAQCALGYGAVIDKDPGAVAIAKSCGLTDAMLAEDADVCRKVVNFFEMYFKGDPQVLLSFPTPQEWHPGPIELSYYNWCGMKTGARTKAEPRATDLSVTRDARDVDQALINLEKAVGGAGVNGYEAERDERAKRGAPLVEYYKSIIEALDAFEAACKGYSPVSEATDGTSPRHSGLREVIEAYAQRATTLKRLVLYDAVGDGVDEAVGSAVTEAAPAEGDDDHGDVSPASDGSAAARSSSEDAVEPQPAARED